LDHPTITKCGKRKTQNRDFSANKRWETTMRRTILTALAASLIAALTAQAAVASEPHHARTKSRAMATEQWRNSNAYAAPRDIGVQWGGSSYANGAMASGIAGH
jgi:hypothetical protein